MNDKQKKLISILIAMLCICTMSMTFIACSNSKSVSSSNQSNNSATSDSNVASELITLPEVTTQEPTTTAPDIEIDMMMIGDILAHEGVYKSGLMDDGTYNFDHLFKNILSDTAASDINVVNQEVILGGTELGLSAYPCFNSPYEIGDAEVKAGFNVVLGASNHPLDKWTDGLNNCMNFWSTKHPETMLLGLNKSQEEQDTIPIYEKNGFKVALLNYTYGCNGIPLPDSMPYCVNLLDTDKITADVTKAKELADMVVVFPHWGTEYSYEPDSNQVYWTNLFLNLGVDVVLGDHPHVIEPVETITREDGHQMVVFYSIGNFVCNQNEKPRVIGGMAKVLLVKKASDGSCYIKGYSFEPVIAHIVFGQGKITTYKLSEYTDSLANENWIKQQEGCSDFTISYCQQLCSMVLGEDYNPTTSKLSVTLNP